MTRWISAAAACATLLLATPAHADDISTFYSCERCDGWNRPHAPFKIFGNTWYVGTEGLSAILVTSPHGHVLLDGALPQSAPEIIHNIEALGFRIQDVKLILNSHAHFDHAGGIPALAKASGATVAASASGAKVLETGKAGPDDPQYDPKHPEQVAPIKNVQVVRDGEKLRVGDVEITAIMTPGHTPGATSYTWKACEDGRCADVVYADSLNPVSSSDFRFTGDATHPDITPTLEASIAKIAALKCDVILSVHPDVTDTFEKQKAARAGHDAFMAPGGCKAYAAGARERLEKRIAEERRAPAKH